MRHAQHGIGHLCDISAHVLHDPDKRQRVDPACYECGEISDSLFPCASFSVIYGSDSHGMLRRQNPQMAEKRCEQMILPKQVEQLVMTLHSLKKPVDELSSIRTARNRSFELIADIAKYRRGIKAAHILCRIEVPVKCRARNAGPLTYELDRHLCKRELFQKFDQSISDSLLGNFVSF
nr:hypothetical protein [Coriobacterium glomerans]